jgi:signal transduction histidine kinase/CHASE2 domain-containing sensor protein
VGIALPWAVETAHPESVTPEERRTAQLSDEALARAVEQSGRVALAVPLRLGRSDPTPAPSSAVVRAAQATGFRELRQDDDGLVRRAALAAAQVGVAEVEQNWAVAVARVAREPVSLPATSGQFNDFRNGRIFEDILGIPFAASSAGAYPVYPYAAVMSGEVALESFRDKIVLVGPSGALPERPVRVPGESLFAESASMPALRIDAELLAGVLDERLIVPLSRSTTAALSALLAGATLLALLLHARGTAVALGGGIVTLLASILLLRFAHVWFAPSAALLGVAAAVPWWRWRELRAASTLLDRQLRILETQPGSFAENQLEKLDSSAARGRWRFLAAARALARVHELRHFLARFLDDLSVPALVTNLDGHVVFANRGARQYFAALGNTQLDGAQLPYLLGGLAPDPVPPEFSWWDVLDTSSGVRQAGGRDALGRDMLVWVTSWYSVGAQHAGWVVTLVEVSAIRAAERARDAALHFMTGELCAPVQGILAQIRKDLKEPAWDALIEGVERDAQRTLELAEKFVQLALSRSHDYSFLVRPLHESIELAIDANEPYAERRRAKIGFRSAAKPVYARIDPDMFWRAVHTLVLNALRFGPEAGTVQVDLLEAADGREVSIVVANEGPGIAPSDQARLIRILQNIELTSPGHAGRDLGIAFVKGVLERHAGRLEFTSNPGEATAFRITLASCAAPVAAIKPERIPERPSGAV